jgi:hypothetical protein
MWHRSSDIYGLRRGQPGSRLGIAGACQPNDHTEQREEHAEVTVSEPTECPQRTAAVERRADAERETPRQCEERRVSQLEVLCRSRLEEFFAQKRDRDDPQYSLQKTAEHICPSRREQLGDGLHVAQASPVHRESDDCGEKNGGNGENDIRVLHLCFFLMSVTASRKIE